jgi:hypothetical protein
VDSRRLTERVTMCEDVVISFACLPAEPRLLLFTVFRPYFASPGPVDPRARSPRTRPGSYGCALLPSACWEPELPGTASSSTLSPRLVARQSVTQYPPFHDGTRSLLNGCIHVNALVVAEACSEFCAVVFLSQTNLTRAE